MSKNKKYMIEYLDINENFYIENDEVKLHLREDSSPQRATWDEVWMGAWEIIEAALDYNEKNTKHNIR